MSINKFGYKESEVSDLNNSIKGVSFSISDLVEVQRNHIESLKDSTKKQETLSKSINCASWILAIVATITFVWEIIKIFYFVEMGGIAPPSNMIHRTRLHI